eukprot:SAG31_NODE_6690_length_1923_cov_6.610197_1_plen_75_part_00
MGEGEGGGRLVGGIAGRGEGEEVSRPQDGREAPLDGAVVEKGSGLHGGINLNQVPSDLTRFHRRKNVIRYLCTK